MKRHRSRKPKKNRKEEQTAFFSEKENKSLDNSNQGAFFQAKLEIGDPGDAFEQEMEPHSRRLSTGHGKGCRRDGRSPYATIPRAGERGPGSYEEARAPGTRGSPGNGYALVARYIWPQLSCAG